MSLRISVSWLLSRRLARRRLSNTAVRQNDDAVAPAHGRVTEGGGHEGLADPDRAHDHHVVAGVDEAQRAQLVPDLAVEVDLGRPRPSARGTMSGSRPCAAGPQGGRGGLAPGHLVGEHELQELGVAHVPRLGQREALGEGVEAAAELDGWRSTVLSSAEMSGGGRAHADAPAVVASAPRSVPSAGLWVHRLCWEKCESRRRAGRSAPVSRRALDGQRLDPDSVPRSSMRPMSDDAVGLGFGRFGTRHVDLIGPHFLTRPSSA